MYASAPAWIINQHIHTDCIVEYIGNKAQVMNNCLTCFEAFPLLVRSVIKF